MVQTNIEKECTYPHEDQKWSKISSAALASPSLYLERHCCWTRSDKAHGCPAETAWLLVATSPLLLILTGERNRWRVYCQRLTQITRQSNCLGKKMLYDNAEDANQRLIWCSADCDKTRSMSTSIPKSKALVVRSIESLEREILKSRNYRSDAAKYALQAIGSSSIQSDAIPLMWSCLCRRNYSRYCRPEQTPPSSLCAGWITRSQSTN